MRIEEVTDDAASSSAPRQQQQVTCMHAPSDTDLNMLRAAADPTVTGVVCRDFWPGCEPDEVEPPSFANATEYRRLRVYNRMFRRGIQNDTGVESLFSARLVAPADSAAFGALSLQHSFAYVPQLRHNHGHYDDQNERVCRELLDEGTCAMLVAHKDVVWRPLCVVDAEEVGHIWALEAYAVRRDDETGAMEPDLDVDSVMQKWRAVLEAEKNV